MEEKCVRAIVGGALERYRSCHKKQQQQSSKESNGGDGGVSNNPDIAGNNNDNGKMTAEAALESARRSLSRVYDLLERLTASMNHPWVFETMAYFQANIGLDEKVYESLMKEYRSLQTVRGWEKDDGQVEKVCHVVSQIVRLSQHNDAKSKKQEMLAKSKFLLSGVIQRVKKSRQDSSNMPEALTRLETLLEEVTSQID